MNYWYIGFVLLLAGILFWRLVLPGMKLVETAQTAGPAAANKSPPEKKVPWGWIIGIPLAILVGLGLWWSLPWQSPSLATVRDGIWSYWLWILILCGIALGASSIWGGKHKSALQTTAWGVAVMSFIVIPLLAWMVSPPTAGSQAHTMRNTIPLASDPKPRWLMVTIPPGGRSESIPVPGYMHIVTAGSGFRLHTVYADGTDCVSACPDGPIASTYFKNIESVPVTVSYAFNK